MLTLRALLSLPTFLSTALIAQALAASSQDGFPQLKTVAPEYAAALTGGERCDSIQLRQIRDGFEDMHALFASALPLHLDSDAEFDFFGLKERISNYTSMIEGNLQRARLYASPPRNGTRLPDIHVRCDDPNDYCDAGSGRQGRHVAYNIGNEPHINFCRRFFGLAPLVSHVDEVFANTTVNMDIMNYYNRATAWARQVMHISNVGTAIVQKAVAQDSNGQWRLETHNAQMNTSVLAGVANGHPDTGGPNDIQAMKYAFGATRAKLLAFLSTQEPYDAANNAESYALFAQARYIMDKKRMYPFMPAVASENQGALLADNELHDSETIRYACFDATDVVPRNARTNAIGAPITSSGASMGPTNPYRLSAIAAGVYVLIILLLFY